MNLLPRPGSYANVAFAIVLTLAISSCEKRKESGDNAAIKIDSATKAIAAELSPDSVLMATFSGVNNFEGDISIIFEDSLGREHWFKPGSDSSASIFYMTETESEPPLVEVNEKLQGKQFRIVFVTEMRENEFSGEENAVRVIKEVSIK
ncbi:hypothetical protein WSM22_10010 [Cytophagales bacterium WSM2-2]|nr:hypothetical protein WSM22_10010 [Cytophagales bacterium WSM2-2]